MLGDRGVAQAQKFREIANRALAVDQLTDDQETMPVRKSFQEIARPVGGVFHDRNIYLHSCEYTIIRIYSQDRIGQRATPKDGETRYPGNAANGGKLWRE